MAKRYVPARGDVVWLRFDPRSGHEQSGRRPALVVSPRTYNGTVGLALVCPITSRVKGYPFEVLLPEGGEVEGAILSDQLKSLDWKARDAKRIETVEDDVMEAVVARIIGDAPLRWPKYTRGTRAYRLDRFPYRMFMRLSTMRSPSSPLCIRSARMTIG